MCEENARQTVLEKHAKACWNVLEAHTKKSACSCYKAVDGRLTITDCLLGRNAQEEYDIAISRLEDYINARANA